MHISIATGSIAAIPLIQNLATSSLLTQLIIPEPHNELEGIYSQFVEPGLIVKTTQNEATNLNDIIDTDILISIGYPYRIGALEQSTKGLNVHFGALPENRGPDPVFWTLRKGKKIAYISVHKLSEKFDEGDILIQKGHPIMPGENYGLLYAKLGTLLVPMIKDLLTGGLKGTPQDVANAQYLNKPKEEEIKIDWNEPARQVENLINACNPKYNGAFTSMNGAMLRIFEAVPVQDFQTNDLSSFNPGQIINVSNEGVFVLCGHDSVICLRVVSLNEGIFSGAKLGALGLNQNITFE